MGELTIRSWELKDVALCLFMTVIINFVLMLYHSEKLNSALSDHSTLTHTQIIYQTNIYI